MRKASQIRHIRIGTGKIWGCEEKMSEELIWTSQPAFYVENGKKET